jgi:hypothetical protein
VSIKIYKKAEGAGEAEENDSLLRTAENILIIEKNHINRYYAENRKSEFSFLAFTIFSASVISIRPFSTIPYITKKSISIFLTTITI